MVLFFYFQPFLFFAVSQTSLLHRSSPRYCRILSPLSWFSPLSTWMYFTHLCLLCRSSPRHGRIHSPDDFLHFDFSPFVLARYFMYGCLLCCSPSQHGRIHSPGDDFLVLSQPPTPFFLAIIHIWVSPGLFFSSFPGTHTCSVCAGLAVKRATHCNELQHTLLHCHTMLRTATPCKTLQHFATHGLEGSGSGVFS